MPSPARCAHRRQLNLPAPHVRIDMPMPDHVPDATRTSFAERMLMGVILSFVILALDAVAFYIIDEALRRLPFMVAVVVSVMVLIGMLYLMTHYIVYGICWAVIHISMHAHKFLSFINKVS